MNTSDKHWDFSKPRLTWSHKCTGIGLITLPYGEGESCPHCNAMPSLILRAPPVDIQEKQAVQSALDVQEGGSHYKKLGAYQPWEVAYAQMTAEEFKGAMKITVMSYLSREADKGGMGDIRKAAHTMQIYLELEGRRQNAAIKPDPTIGGA